MPPDLALQPVPAEPDRARLKTLEVTLAKREADLAALKQDLRALQSKYLDQIGGLYAELSTLEASLADEEIRRGFRPPPPPDDDPPDDGSQNHGRFEAEACSNPAAPSDGLKRIFRDLAKAVHPDLAMDEPARYRRHSLMAEANRAYAERDEDRLRLILRAWEHSPDAVVGDDPDADLQRVRRRIAEIDDRLIAIEAELADVRASAIWRLKGKIDDARAQGWDLFAEMVVQVKNDIRRTSSRLAKLQRQA